DERGEKSPSFLRRRHVGGVHLGYLSPVRVRLPHLLAHKPPAVVVWPEHLFDGLVNVVGVGIVDVVEAVLDEQRPSVCWQPTATLASNVSPTASCSFST